MASANPGTVLAQARRRLIEDALMVITREIQHPGTAFHIHYPEPLWERIEASARLLTEATRGWHEHIDRLREEHGHGQRMESGV